MSSVRVTAAGAVAVVVLSFLTAPVSACDDRYIRKCESATAAAAAAAEQQAAPAPAATKRKAARTVHEVKSRTAQRPHVAQRSHGPRFALRDHGHGMTLASASSHMIDLPSESALARRFRGFIDPQPIALNTFESLRRPKLDINSLAPSAALPVNEAVASVEGLGRDGEAAAAPAMVTRDIKLAAADPAAATALMRASAAPVFLTQQSNEGPGGFSFHKLVLAVCAALGTAGAVRFIVSV